MPPNTKDGSSSGLAGIFNKASRNTGQPQQKPNEIISLEGFSVTIVGAGFSGTLASIRLLEQAYEHRIDTVALIEKQPGRECGGVAYSKKTCRDFHETNIPANRLSYRSNEPSHFYEWWKEQHELQLIPEELDYIKPSPFRNVPRRLVQIYLDEHLERAIRNARRDGIIFRKIEGQVADIEETQKSASITLEDGRKIDTGKAIVATGHSTFSKPPFIKEELLEDTNFTSRYIDDQWSQNGQQAIDNIPEYATVMVVGTALSGWDAARSLLRNGHKGEIILTSRNGYEHSAYEDENKVGPGNITRQLPRPKFLGFWNPNLILHSALEEFEELTGVKIDANTGEITARAKQGLIDRMINGPRMKTEEVLQQWEKHIPELAENVGVYQFGNLIRKFGSLVNTLRVGAGYNISKEIDDAKRSGQIKVLPAHIINLEADSSGINVDYRKNHGKSVESQPVDFVISSLGPNTNYEKTKDPLWQKLIRTHHYTRPHETGIGIKTATQYGNPGRLESAHNIFVVGTPNAGERMINNAVLGPPAFSIPGMRASIEDVADYVADLNLRSTRSWPRKKIRPSKPFAF